MYISHIYIYIYILDITYTYIICIYPKYITFNFTSYIYISYIDIIYTYIYIIINVYLYYDVPYMWHAWDYAVREHLPVRTLKRGRPRDGGQTPSMAGRGRR